MATNGNSGIIHYGATVDTFPLSQALTGTVSATDVEVAGIGTTFTTSIGYNGSDITIPAKTPLGYLFDAVHSEWRKITFVLSDTSLYIDKPFSNVLSGATVRWTPQSRTRSLAFTDIGASGVVDGVSLQSGEGGAWEQINFIDPPITPHTFVNVDITYSYT